MTDDELGVLWTTVAPAARQRQRIDAQVSAWLEAHDTPLSAEWLGLVRVSPFATLSLAAVSAVAVLLATPFVWLARAYLTAAIVFVQP